ncbi:Armadillo-like helical [Cynara cardunculus var. scolymus]|uniref:Armadillo-like helical n=1 Tax=Cynara cardunculus var. scolymus TaxID=59895 RepID=A0A118K6B4_CYNCS|nr:Armadillo-like helical [Cynara cardunculus var. scolymus]
MNIVEKESIEVIAQSIGVGNLSPDVLPSLAADIEYRISEIMQEAVKCMRHAKRTAMTSDDVDSALELRKMEPIYVASGDSLRFKRAARHKDLFYVEDKDVEFREVIAAALPKAPPDTAVVNHWLAIEGVQPAIPENASLEALLTPFDNKKPDYKEDGVSIDIKTPVKHVLSIELQLYFEKITDLTVSRSNSIIFNKALLSLATDVGLHPLVPYFIYFVAEEVTRNLNNFQLLFALMRLVRSLLQNPFLHIEPYLHQLMPSVMTCLVAKSLGNKLTDNHWELRNFTANLVASICRRFGNGYHNLQLRVTRTLLHAFLDPAKAFPQHYGAIKGITALGSSVVRLLLLPNLDPYLHFLEPEMQLENQKNESRRHEAWQVHGALMLKMIPNLFSPPTHAIWKSNGNDLTINPNKRKAGINNLMMEQTLKKTATGDGSVGGQHLVKVEVPGASSGFSITRGASDVGVHPLPRFLPNDTIPGSSGRRDKFGSVAQTSSSVAVARAWKKEINAGHLLPKLYDLFGESMLPFVLSPELCNIFI